MRVHLLILLLVAIPGFGTESAYFFYQVKKSDHLARILRTAGYPESSLWGEGGIIEKVVQANPWLEREGEDHLPIGVYLKLPIKDPVKKKEKKIATKKKIDKSPKVAIKFSAPANRNYEIALVETDGKKNFKKISYPLKIVKEKGESHFVLDKVNNEELGNAALKPIPHFKENFFSEKKIVQVETLNGETIEKVEYEPWELQNKFFVRGSVGTKMSSITTSAPQEGSLTISPSPGLAGSLYFGIHFTKKISLFTDIGADYLAFKAPAGANLGGATQITGHLGSGLKHIFTPNWAGAFSVRYRRDIFVSGNSASTLTLTSIFRPEVDIDVFYAAWKNGPHVLFVEGRGMMLLSRKTTAITLNTSYGAKMKLRYRLQLNEKNQLDFAGFYEMRSQKTSNSEDTISVYGAGIEYSWN